MDLFNWTPSTGLNDVTQFPAKDSLIRKHIQDLLDQVKDFINNDIAVAVNFIVPTLVNSWVAYASYTTPGYWKDAMGVVHLRGAIKGGTAGTTAFTLPPGYRSSEDGDFAVISNNSLGYIYIQNTTGVVQVTAGNTAWVGLSGISFYADL